MFSFSFWKMFIKYSKTIQLLFLVSAVIIDKAKLCFKLLYSFIDEVPPRSIQWVENNLATLSIFLYFRGGKLTESVRQDVTRKW